MNAVKVGARYKHYKGGVYTVIGIGTHTDTHTEVVVYKDGTERIWVRPIDQWFEQVGNQKRFERID